MTSVTDIRVGVVGCGSIGRRYIEWLTDLGVQVATFDTDPSRLHDLPPGVRAYDRLLDFEHWQPSKIIIATPPQHHATAVSATINCGADFLIEKPLAPDLEAGRLIATILARQGRKAWGVCNMRFHPAISQIAEILPRLGRPLSVHAFFSHRLSQMRPHGTAVYAASAADGGGVILDCIHEFDYLQWLLGPIVRTRGWTARIGDDPIQADDIADIQVEFASGCHGVIHFDFLSRLKRRGLEIIGTDATVLWQSTGKTPEHCEVVFGSNQGHESVLCSANIDAFEPYRQMLRSFLDDASTLQTMLEARATLAIALASATPEWCEPCVLR